MHNLPTIIQTTIENEELIKRKLLTIELKTTDPLRILENDTFEKITLQNRTYLAAPLKLSEIQRNDNMHTVSATLSNASGAISSLIGSFGDVITGANCIIEEVFLDEFGTIISDNAYPIFVGVANHLVLTPLEITLDIEAVLGSYITQSPNMTYGTSCQWRKFKDCMCAYSGTESFCDKSLTRCIELGNQTNFGGFPSLPKEQVIKAL